MNLVSYVRDVTSYDWYTGLDSRQGQDFFFAITSTFLTGLKRPGREAYHSPRFTAYVKGWNYVSSL